MKALLRTCHTTLQAALVGLLAVVFVVPVPAARAAAGSAPTSSSIVIHDAQETLRDWCRPDSQGALWLVLPGGITFELVTSTDDPAISNHGDGAFHAFDAGEVSAALAAVSYPLDGVTAEIFILPYPRRAGLTSGAGPGLILLSPGVYPLPREQQHSEFIHELGHVVQYVRLPDQDATSWSRYRTLRGITDVSVYSDSAAHADRPHEIFAEDFRALFGGALAHSTGNVENASLTPPTQIAGLADFMLQLSGPSASGSSLSGPSLTVTLGARPNPARGPVLFSRKGSAMVALDLFDLAGRRLARVAPEAVSDGVRWNWDGLDESGHRVGPGVVFARARDGSAGALVTLLP
jgi:hypothetical protein